MRILIVAMLCVLLAGVADAQTPQFKAGTWDGVSTAVAAWNTSAGSIPQRQQGLYSPATFSGVKEGAITSVYLRNFKSSVNAKDTVSYRRVTIKLGYAADSAYRNGPGSFPVDTYRTNLTTVVDLPNKQFTGMKNNLWRKFTFNAGNFSYTKSQNLVVDVTFDSSYTHAWWAASHGSISTNINRSITGRANIDSGVVNRLALDFGFDLATTGIEAAGKVVSFGLFPNPSTGGQTNVSFATKVPAKEVVVSVANATGQELLRRVWANAGTEFFQEINLNDAPRGVYFVTTVIDGERITRRLLVN